jgi:hypothetical protein
LILVYFTSPLTLNSASLNVSGEVLYPVYNIGDKISIIYHYENTSNLQLVLPDFAGIIKSAEVLTYQLDTIHHQVNLTLITFESGDVNVPAITFIFEDINTHKIYTAISNEIRIYIKNIELDEHSTIQELLTENLHIYNINYLIISIILVISIFIAFIILKKSRHTHKTGIYK